MDSIGGALQREESVSTTTRRRVVRGGEGKVAVLAGHGRCTLHAARTTEAGWNRLKDVWEARSQLRSVQPSADEPSHPYRTERGAATHTARTWLLMYGDWTMGQSKCSEQ